MYSCATAIVPTITLETNPAGQEPARVWNTIYEGAVIGSDITTGAASTSSSTKSSTQSGSSSSSGTSQDSPNGESSTNPADGEDKTLSTTTIIGIAVGGFLGICAVVLGGIWYYRSNKRRGQVVYHQRPNVAYNYPAPAPFIAPPQPYGWQPPKPMYQHMPPSQNYRPVQTHGGSHVSSGPVSPISSSPALYPARHEIGSVNRPRPHVAEIGPGR